MIITEILNDSIIALDDKKGINIKTIDVRDISSLTDYFVVCSGTSTTHIKALSESVKKRLKENGVEPKKIEGYQTAKWILMDFGDVVVNIFDQAERDFYRLESMWADAKLC